MKHILVNLILPQNQLRIHFLTQTHFSTMKSEVTKIDLATRLMASMVYLKGYSKNISLVHPDEKVLDDPNSHYLSSLCNTSKPLT